MTRQRRATPYYGEMSPVPPPAGPAVETKPEPLYGAQAIAAELGCAVHVIYRIAEAPAMQWESRGLKRPPIRKLPCMGLTADRRELWAWWRETFGAGIVEAR